MGCKMKVRYYVFIAVITLFLAGVSLLEGSGEEELEESKILVRGEPGEGDKDIELELTVPELEETVTYQLSIAEREYNEDEREKLFAQAVKEIEESFPAEGETISRITKPVQLLSRAQDGLIEVEWSFGDTAVILEDGSIDASKVDEKGTLVLVCAQLHYRDYLYIYEFPVCVYPESLDGMERLMKKLGNYFEEKEIQNVREAEVELPKELEGHVLNWSHKKSYSTLWILGLGAFAMILIPWYMREKEEKRRQERKAQLEMEYPGMLAEFSLLLGAGMTVRIVWEKLVLSYEEKQKQGKRKKSEVLEQMKLTYRQIQDGAGEVSAYEGFAKRCEAACYRRFTMLLTQYLQKGTKGLAETLELEAAQAFENRKNLARRRGEEAGTKLLLPMIMMLFVVIAIMMIPACMTMEL